MEGHQAADAVQVGGGVFAVAVLGGGKASAEVIAEDDEVSADDPMGLPLAAGEFPEGLMVILLVIARAHVPGMAQCRQNFLRQASRVGYAVIEPAAAPVAAPEIQGVIPQQDHLIGFVGVEAADHRLHPLIGGAIHPVDVAGVDVRCENHLGRRHAMILRRSDVCPEVSAGGILFQHFGFGYDAVVAIGEFRHGDAADEGAVGAVSGMAGAENGAAGQKHAQI